MSTLGISRNSSTDRSLGLGSRRWTSLLLVVAVAVVILTTAASATGIAGRALGVLVLGVAWVVLPGPFGFVVATSTAGILLGDAPRTHLLATAGLLLGALVLDGVDPDRRFQEVGLALSVFACCMLLVQHPLRTGDGYWTAGGGLVLGTAVLLYGLHRYVLVRTGQVTNGN